MLKKSLVYSFALTATTGFAVQDSSKNSDKEVIFPSKTYFMMAVDRQIAMNMKVTDVSRLLGLTHISDADETMILNGVRRQILREAAVKWDTGVASSYGRNLEQMIGWQVDPSELSSTLNNRVSLFRYALESNKASEVLQRYERKLSPQYTALNPMEIIENGNCEALVDQSHFNFYEQLSSLDTRHTQSVRIAKQFEQLSACQKCAIGTWINTYQDNITADRLKTSISDIQQLSDPRALLSMVSSQ